MSTVGEILKTEREKLGLSIKDIEKETCIRSLYLTAIEEGNYSILPGEAYLKGFIRNYANFVGLDGQTMIAQYKEEIAPTKSTAVTDNINADHAETNTLSQPPKNNTFPWIIILLVLTTLGGAAYWYLTGNPAPTPAPSNLTSPDTTPKPLLPKKTPDTPANNLKKQVPVVISVKFIDNCWTTVAVDGNQVFEGTPQINKTITWEAQKNIIIKFGDADAVQVTYNGVLLPPLGNDGEVIEKTFLPKR